MDLNNLFEVIQNTGQKSYSRILDNFSEQNISVGSSSWSYMSSNGFVFKQYKDLQDSFNFLQETRQKTNKKAYETSALGFVDGYDYQNFERFNAYINNSSPKFEKIKSISETIIENIKTIINLGGMYENDKIIITEDSRGIFDFGLASLGLFRPIEFYSETLKNDIQTGVVKNVYAYMNFEDGVINADDIFKNSIGEKNIFVYKLQGKEYLCERRQKGATKVFNTFPKECFLKTNTDGIITTFYLDNQNKVFNGRGNARLKYASNNKKSYLIYNKKDDSVKNVDIFMPINFLSGIKDSSRALLLLPAYLICATLEEFGIQTRLSAVRLGSDASTHISISVPVKDYSESSKEAFNRVFKLLSTSKSAEDFFAFLKVTAENEGVQAGATGSINSGFKDVQYQSRFYINDMIQRYKNWSEANKEQPFINTKVTNPNFQFMLPTIDRNIAEDNLEYSDILSRLHDIFFTFYYYMDFLAIEMLTMDKFVAQIYKRMTEDVTFKKLFTIPSDKQEIKNVIQKYVISILVEKYKKVVGGAYSDTPEQANKKDQTFVEKVKSLNESLNRL